MLSCLIIVYGPLLTTCNCNYFLLQRYGQPSSLQRFLKVVISISPEAAEFIKLLFLYLNKMTKVANLTSTLGKMGIFLRYLI